MSFDKSLYIITDQGAHGDSRYKNVSKQPDTLTGEVAENKQVFDDYPDLISERHNSLINNLESVVASSVTETVLKSALLDIFYPVGSYYETSKSVSEFHPETAWGGTWELETSGQVHVSAGTGYNVGATGGEATHTLTALESGVAQHTHAFTQPEFSTPKLTHSVTQPTITMTKAVSISNHGATACTRTTNVALSGGAHSHYAESGRRFVEYDAGATLYSYAIASDYYQANGYSSKSYAFFPNTGTLSAGSGKPADETFQSNIATASATPSFTITQPAFNTPSLSHTVTQPTFSASGTAVGDHSATACTRTTNGAVGNTTTASASSAHNNMQPYIVVNRWHRTA